MADIQVNSETEEHNRWAYDVEVFQDGRVHRYKVTLGFSDYDHWTRGKSPPSRVVEAIFRFLLEREPADAILTKFDCALVRRYFPEVDAKLPGMITPNLI